MRNALVGLAVLAAGVAIALPRASAGTSTRSLVGTVGPEDTIVLTTNGRKVTALTAGAYTITVRDKASDHDFHLYGPGVNKTTSVSGTGTVVWRVTLRKGTYKFICDPHSTFMKGSFTVK
ncbi:MAG TPA: plastocyanin/azurin family copper-binding protein [Gaiellaceae bacterium]|nr:plastocyanin/azurin family copper-binding protein [Gaiellaceae bacterium]